MVMQMQAVMGAAGVVCLLGMAIKNDFGAPNRRAHSPTGASSHQGTPNLQAKVQYTYLQLS
jgi:hypothetical protein